MLRGFPALARAAAFLASVAAGFVFPRSSTTCSPPCRDITIARVAPRVRELCARHGVAYVERGFLAGLLDVWRVLARVGRAARTGSGLARIAPLENRSEPGA